MPEHAGNKKFIPQASKLDYSIVEAGMLKFDRETAFKELRAGLKAYKQDAVLRYGWCGDQLPPNEILKMISIFRDPEKDSVNMIDYVLVYEFIRQHKTAGQEKVYWVEAPMRFSPKSLNAYMFYKQHNQLNSFFKDFISSTMKIKPPVFEGYLQASQGLSMRPKMLNPTTKEKIPDPNYWKNPDNINRTIKAIAEMGVLYREKQ